MPIYTKTGDKGRTSLYTNSRVPKSSLRVSAIGHIDELNSCLGMVRSFLSNQPQLQKVNQLLERLQRVLFEVGSELAGNNKYQLNRSHTRTLEQVIDHYQEKLPELRRFILPTGTPPAAFLHHARAVARRTERVLVMLSEKENPNSEIIKFLNRLSDLLFVLARYANQVTKGQETFWRVK